MTPELIISLISLVLSTTCSILTILVNIKISKIAVSPSGCGLAGILCFTLCHTMDELKNIILCKKL